LFIPLSLYTLTHSSKGKEEGKEKRGRLEVTLAAEHHGLHLKVEHHKGWGIEEGGALSSSPHWS